MASESKRLIVITGCTRGLGRAMTDGMIAAGHTVIGCGRSSTEIAELRGRYASPHNFEIVDVSRDDEVKAWAKRVIDELGPPDLLLNNAAIINRSAPLWEISADEFSKMLDINVSGVVNCIRHFVPAMIAKGTGVIVNFSSGWGRSTAPEVAPYCATKFAIEGLTRALAQELPEGMAAVPLNPGIINTEMLQSTFGSSASSYPTAEKWGRKAVPFLLKLGFVDNGRSLSIGD